MDELQKLLENFRENKSNVKNSNYPAQITNPKMEEFKEDPLKINIYVDGSKTDRKTFFNIVKVDELSINKDCIEELLTNHSLNEKEKYYLICNILASNKYCHYVLGNKKILEKSHILFEKYKPIFRYIMSYSWISLYIEECIKKTKIKQSDRFVFDIDTVSNLPTFPFCSQNPYLNPYFTCMVSDNLLKFEQNINGVKHSSDYQNGTVNLEEFRRRLNIFISGKENINLLNGANWDNMAITGGLMAAIIPKTNPLMALFKSTQDPKIPMSEQELNRFFQEYYAKSDIDIACKHSNILDFIEHVKHIKSIIHSNLDNNIMESDIHINPIKSLAIYINAPLLKEKCERGEIPFKYDFIINNKNKRMVKFYFYELYIEQKKLSNEKNKQFLGNKISQDEYFEILDYCALENTTVIINDKFFSPEIIENRSPESNSGIEMVFFMKEKNRMFVTDIDDDDNEDNDDNKDKYKTPDFNIFIKFSETLKYKITSKHLKHPFEIFRISHDEFFSCIGRFHLPCVRAYYNGNNCYLLPSAITAYQTLTNIDFKYFVGSHDPISIIDKYRNRGYGTILNKTELNQYLSYIISVGNYKKMYGINDNKEIKNIMGNLDVSHDYFKPRKVIPEEFIIDSNIKLDYQSVKMDYFSSKDDISKYYEKKYKKYPTEFIEKRVIQSDGKIQPLKYWMIDASYDILN